MMWHHLLQKIISHVQVKPLASVPAVPTATILRKASPPKRTVRPAAVTPKRRTDKSYKCTSRAAKSVRPWPRVYPNSEEWPCCIKNSWPPNSGCRLHSRPQHLPSPEPTLKTTSHQSNQTKTM